jgi:ankyrin repeat protein
MDREEEFKLARKMQDLFRDAIKALMEGSIPDLEATTQRFLSSHEGCSVEDMVIDFHSEGKTLLHVAASSGKYAVLEYLLSACSTDNLRQMLESVTLPGSLVAGSGSSENVKNLKRLVNLKDHRGFTTLINATVSENEDAMRLLLRLGADPNARNDDGAGAVHFAASDGSISRLKLLAEYGAKFDQHSKSGTPLHWAAGKGRDEAIKFILEHAQSVDVNSISAEGLPPVLMAAVASADEGVRALVEAGADIGMIVSGNLTTLHICAEHGLLKAVQAIVATETGKNCCNLTTNEGNSPLVLAMMGGHRDVVRVLLPLTATVDLPDNMKSLSMDDQLDFLIEDGKRRLAEWEAHHQKIVDATAVAISPDAASSARFDAVSSPEKTADVEREAESAKDEANTLYKNGKFVEAIEFYNKAIALDKMNAVYWSNRSACFLSMKKNHEALLDAEICRRLRPDWPKGCYRLASARLAEGHYEDAAVAAFEGCKLDNNNEELKSILQKAVKKGQEEHKKNLELRQQK